MFSEWLNAHLGYKLAIVGAQRLCSFYDEQRHQRILGCLCEQIYTYLYLLSTLT